MSSPETQLEAIARIMGNQKRKTGIIIKFGKHKGQDISDVPSSYLRWIISELPDDELIEQAEIELDRRK